jgi:hypothetical protein
MRRSIYNVKGLSAKNICTDKMYEARRSLQYGYGTRSTLDSVVTRNQLDVIKVENPLHDINGAMSSGDQVRILAFMSTNANMIQSDLHDSNLFILE